MVCLSICLSVHMYVYLSVFCMYVCLSVCLFVCMSVCLSVYMYAFLSVCMSACIYVCLYVCMSVCLFVWLSVCLYVGMSVCLSLCLTFYISMSPVTVSKRSDRERSWYIIPGETVQNGIIIHTQLWYVAQLKNNTFIYWYAFLWSLNCLLVIFKKSFISPLQGKSWYKVFILTPTL